MHKLALLGSILGSALASGCVSEDEAVVFVEPSITGPSAAIETGVLGATVSGEFHLKLVLGPRASGPSAVQIGSVAITNDENSSSVVPSLSLIASQAFPVTVAAGSEVTVDFLYDIGDKVIPETTRSALCLPAGVRIAGTIKDSHEDAAAPFASAPFQATGCM